MFCSLAARSTARRTVRAGTAQRTYASVRTSNVLTPAVARLVAEHQLDGKLADIRATGPKGRILKGDVLVFLGKIKPRDPPKPMGVQGPPPGTGSTMATRTAQRQREVSVEQATALLTTLQKKRGLKLSLNDLVMRAMALALIQVPSTAAGTVVDVATAGASAILPVAKQTRLAPIERAAAEAQKATASTERQSRAAPFLAVSAPRTVTVDPRQPPATKPLAKDQLYDFLLDASPVSTSTHRAAPAAETSAASAPAPAAPGLLLDYLLDTNGRVPLPNLRTELPHQEQHVTLTIVTGTAVDATLAGRLLDCVAGHLERPEALC
ncbi:hypothetical protein THASP1DRAFT_25629 [Thamnocephalis sphaerospora]|uniref:Peripheral subunit-binding (PSBD) domain-containing protein n=1 Tax=Thamnocephalis sphaerospora TaxID=78915 RepID=A0A4P9XJN3_9FUNG|nr:hypothetical protein THASP1DRAFT_25629 [Thamnocephalis sphaerospora]|eukprot:RKP05962.1 hypothetical protein THASP1DRAFT_25629 [Thamnocephalis sphaerospora]